MGVAIGNLIDVTSSLRKTFTEFSNGVVLSGKVEKELDKIAKSMGLKWSMQDKQLLFLGRTQFIGTLISKLSAGTGLIGSPEPGEDGIVRVQAILQPNLLPGTRIQVDSKEVTGVYRIEKTVFVGDTWGDDWSADLECKPL